MGLLNKDSLFFEGRASVLMEWRLGKGILLPKEEYIQDAITPVVRGV